MKYIVLLLLLASAVSGLEFSEIMYNPSGSDSGREWVELYTDEVLNVAGLKFFEAGVNHKTAIIQGEEMVSGYFLIIDKPDYFFADHPEVEVSNIVVLDSSFSLSNSGEYLAVKRGDEILAEVNYSAIAAEGMSIMYDDGWIEGDGVPGNIEVDIEINLSCDISIDIETERDVYDNGEKIEYKHRLVNEIDDKKYSYKIEYWIDDIFSENIKKKYNTTNVNKKTWTASTDDKLSVVMLKAIVYPDCEDINMSNNYVDRMIVVKNFEEDECFLDILLDKMVVDSGESMQYKHIAEKGSEIEYWIEDIEGSIVRDKRNTTNTNKKSFTPKIDAKEKVYFMKARVGDCEAEKVLLVKNSDYEEEENEVQISQSSGYIDYRLRNVPLKVSPNSTFAFDVEIVTDDAHDFLISSYVYRGSKVYSIGDRDSNEQTIEVGEKRREIVRMKNSVGQLDAGIYNLRVVIRKDNQKTEHVLREEIIVEEERVCPVAVCNSVPQMVIRNATVVARQQGIVYESKNAIIEKNVGNGVMVFLGLSAILTGVGRIG